MSEDQTKPADLLEQFTEEERRMMRAAAAPFFAAVISIVVGKLISQSLGQMNGQKPATRTPERLRYDIQAADNCVTDETEWGVYDGSMARTVAWCLNPTDAAILCDLLNDRPRVVEGGMFGSYGYSERGTPYVVRNVNGVVFAKCPDAGAATRVMKVLNDAWNSPSRGTK